MLINGHKLHVDQYGPEDGPEVILLHHGLGSVKAWREQIPALVEHGYHVTAYDRWGYGGSDERNGLDLPTFAADVSDLRGLLKALGITRAALVGHSDGGTTALYFAAQYPTLVSCLISIAAHIYTEPKMLPGIRGIKKAFESDERFRKGLFNAHGTKFEKVFHNWYDGWYRMENLTWDMRPVLEQITCPTLVVQGAEDEHATPKHAEELAEAVPGAEVWILEGAGHMLPLENSVALNPRMLEFLQKYSNGEKRSQTRHMEPSHVQ
jgi:pimeloyl-ACP methyl ester carboxylesterase